mmetsp:Transcript_8916/g.27448  ORF Transcript_8916/g.27448 Transcript_8916/m.27448 type:complete len:230 (-) Transcript_8916:36-725(-)
MRGLRMRATWAYLSRKVRALGTLWSPMCTMADPTHADRSRSAPRMRTMAAYVRGHAWTRCRPWPVSRSAYGASPDRRSASAKLHSRNMSFTMARHSDSDCSANRNCRACECDNRAPDPSASLIASDDAFFFTGGGSFAAARDVPFFFRRCCCCVVVVRWLFRDDDDAAAAEDAKTSSSLSARSLRDRAESGGASLMPDEPRRGGTPPMRSSSSSSSSSRSSSSSSVVVG